MIKMVIFHSTFEKVVTSFLSLADLKIWAFLFLMQQDKKPHAILHTSKNLTKLFLLKKEAPLF